jgi:SET domain-containing protein
MSLGKIQPHDGVYTRLKPSPIHGVGVFAIKDIPKNAYVFEPDDDELVSVQADEIKGLPPDLRRLYEDFCVLKDDTYQCPSSFNKLTPAWFLNTSKNPNVAADSSLKFYAIRDIQAGEELTADYGTYSD